MTFIAAILLGSSAVSGCTQPTEAAKDTSDAANSARDAASTTAAKPVEAEKADAWHEVTIPEGTPLPIVLDTPVGSDSSRAEDPVSAHLAQPIVVDGTEALAEGTTVTGVVT